MSIDTDLVPDDQVGSEPSPRALVRAELPRWAPAAVFGGSLVLVGALLGLAGASTATPHRP